MSASGESPVNLYLEDTNGTVYLAERVGWLSNPERRGGPYGSRNLYEDDEPMYRLLAVEPESETTT